MRVPLPPTRHRMAGAVRRLAAVTVIGLVIGGAAAASTVTRAAAAGAVRASRGALGAAQPIVLNTPDWSGKARFDSRRPAWYTDQSGVVHLQGAARLAMGGETDQVIGVLPPAARPPSEVLTIVHTFDGTYADLEIDPDGVIFFIVPSAPAVPDLGFVSFEGITFRRAGHSNPITANSANWTSSLLGHRPLAWYADQSGVVHLQGAAAQSHNSGAGANMIGTLPPQARPARAVFTVVATAGGTYADLAIQPNGQINLINPRPPAMTDYEAVSLESITYRPSAPSAQIMINKHNWNGRAGFESGRPGWYIDHSGVVHLQGAVRQTSTSGTGANQIGSLPPAARPTHTVFTIVHTFNGTYADLAVLPNGQIDLIDPRPPMVRDYTFVSLESITYRR